MSHRVSSEFPKTLVAPIGSTTYQAPFGQEVSKAKKIYEDCLRRVSSDNEDAWKTGRVFSWKESARHAALPNRHRPDVREPAIPESPDLDKDESFAAQGNPSFTGFQRFVSSSSIAIPRGKSDPIPESPDLMEDQSSNIQKDVSSAAGINQPEADPEDIFAFLS